MIQKLFGKKSNNGFYLEAKEEDEATAPVAPTATETVAEVVVEEPKAESEVKSAEDKTANKTTSSKKKEAKSAATKATPAPKVTKPVQEETPLWIKLLNSSNGKQEEEGDKNFATRFLMPTPTTTRRRPGPSLNGFMDMARQTKTPR